MRQETSTQPPTDGRPETPQTRAEAPRDGGWRFRSVCDEFRFLPDAATGEAVSQ